METSWDSGFDDLVTLYDVEPTLPQLHNYHNDFECYARSAIRWRSFLELALLAYSVTARVREIGVRVALGATRGAVVWMIVRDGLAIAVPGVLIGVACASVTARLVRARLYGIAPDDPRMLLIAAATFLATVIAASLLPALRASRLAPVEALREE